MTARVHPTAIVESHDVGEGTQIWAFVHVLAGAVIGRGCNIGDHCFIESGAVIGDVVTVKNFTAVWDGVRLERGVFVGPAVVFTNDLRPRSPRSEDAAPRYRDRSWLEPTTVCEGATLGAGAVIVAGVTIGAYAMVAAGSVVTRDVKPYTLVVGSPARAHGFVCRCGAKLPRGRESCQRGPNCLAGHSPSSDAPGAGE
jgi:UDP-2-acetamido-3-amino-2,3-dideoxy-glucuronate N-acetyltransferase